MTTPRSYGYKTTLTAPVANNGTVVLPWPADDNASGYVDTANYEVSVGSHVYSHAQASAAFDGGANTITVTNKTGATWPQAQDVYVFCPHMFVTGNNINESFIQIEQTLYDHEGRIAALETP